MDWITKQISKHEILDNNNDNNNNKEGVKKAKQQLEEQQLTRENTTITPERMKEFIILMTIKFLNYGHHQI